MNRCQWPNCFPVPNLRNLFFNHQKHEPAKSYAKMSDSKNSAGALILDAPCANPPPSYWQDPLIPCNPPKDLPKSANVVIIGAGISGCSVALGLSKLGKDWKVVVLDSRGVAGGASGRNGGLLVPGLNSSFGEALKLLGLDSLKRLLRFEKRNLESIKTLIDSLKPKFPDDDPALHQFPSGNIELFSSPEERDEMINDLKIAAEYGLDVGIAVVSPDEAESLTGMKNEYGGLHEKQAYRLNSANLTRLVAKEAMSHGCEFYAPISVTSVEKGTSEYKWQVNTLEGTISTNIVVHCTNAWTSFVLPEAPIVPVRNNVLVTSPIFLDSSEKKIWDLAIGADEGYEYWSVREDGRVVLGGMRNTVPGKEVGVSDDCSINNVVSKNLRRFLLDIIPAKIKKNHEITVEKEWAGILGFTPDNFPFVGGVPEKDGQWICAGFCGHGMPRAHLCGLEVSSMIFNCKLPDDFVEEFTPGWKDRWIKKVQSKDL